MRASVTALAVIPFLLVASCAGSDEDSGDAGSLDGVEVAGEFGDAPEITVEGLKAEEQTSVVLSRGDGPEVDVSRDALIDVTFNSGVDGTELLSTWSNGQPTTIGPQTQLPLESLLTALKSAIDGVPRASRVVFSVPALDIVGEQGLEQIKLEADDAIVGVADILSVQPGSSLDGPEGEPVDPPAGSPEVVEKDGNVTGFGWTGVGAKPTELQVIPLIEGDGPAISQKRLVTFDYFGEVFKGKESFDESYSGDPVTFAVGAGSLIGAWDEGLIGVKEGSRVMIIAPPDKAYGPDGNPPAIPGNATLVFVLDVLDVDG